MKLLTTRQVIVRIAVIISSVEFVIMLLLRAVFIQEGTYAEAVLDAMLLVALSTPAIYKWIILPFVHARDEALEQSSHLAHTDPLTQLANRRLISGFLGKLIAASVRNRDYAAVLLVDLDGFKHINDNYTHEAGDAMLVEIARRLHSIVRSEDVIGRLGGDEYIVLLQRLGGDERVAHDKALRVAEDLINIINAPYDFNGKTLHVGASVGIRLVGFAELDTGTAIREADIAMYRAKEAGGGCAAVFEK
jgi:two-component system cell cycle response regulator